MDIVLGIDSLGKGDYSDFCLVTDQLLLDDFLMTCLHFFDDCLMGALASVLSSMLFLFLQRSQSNTP